MLGEGFHQIFKDEYELKITDKDADETYTHDFARNVKLLFEKEYWGLYNMVCGGTTGRSEVATEVVRLLNREDEIKVTPVDSSYFAEEFFSMRSPSERLINKKLDIRQCNIMRDWKICLNEYLNSYYADYLTDVMH